MVGQVRLRLLTDVTCADLRGPTACALQTPDEMLATVAKLGPDAVPALQEYLARQRRSTDDERRADVLDVGVVVEPMPDQPRERGRVVAVEDADVLGHEITSYPTRGMRASRN